MSNQLGSQLSSTGAVILGRRLALAHPLTVLLISPHHFPFPIYDPADHSPNIYKCLNQETSLDLYPEKKKKKRNLESNEE
jgi:hypothetical protein